MSDLNLEEVGKKATEAVQPIVDQIKADMANLKTKSGEYANSTEMENRLKSIDEAVKELGVKDLREQYEASKGELEQAILKIKKLEEKGEVAPAGDLMSETKAELVKNQAELAKFKHNQNKGHGVVFTVKDAVVSVRSDVSGSTSAMRLAGIGQLSRRRAFMRDMFSQGSIGAGNNGTIRYTDQAAIVSGAASIAEVGAYPITSAISWIERSLPVQKIGDSIKISTEMMDDVDYVMSEIETFLMANIDLEIDRQLLLGTGVAPELKGLATSASEFSLPAGFAKYIPDANFYDVLSIIAANIMYDTPYVPTGVLMNPYDVVKMRLKKDALGNYVMPSFTTQTAKGNVSIDNLAVIAASGVAENTMYMGDFTRGTIYSANTMQFEFGYEQDDFTKDMVTLKGRERLALLIRIVNNGAFRKVSDIETLRQSIQTA